MVVDMRSYETDCDLFKHFMLEFREEKDDGTKVFPYQQQLRLVANRESDHVNIQLEDMKDFDPELCLAIIDNTMRYVELFKETIDKMLPQFRNGDEFPEDKLDVYLAQRISFEEKLAEEDAGYQFVLPGELKRKYTLSVSLPTSPPFEKATSIRDVKALHIGKLVKIRGVVVRASDVKPLMVVATYWCPKCSAEIYQIIRSPQYTPLTQCTSSTCGQGGARGVLFLQTRACKFDKFQELRIQEPADSVPTGSIPRSLTIFVRAAFCGIVTPGDHVVAEGVFLPTEKSGFQAMRSGLMSDTYMETLSVVPLSKTDGEKLLLEPLSVEELTEYAEAVPPNNALEVFASSIAPEIYGHVDIKKVLLLQLVGGVDNNPQGMKVRGNINVCLMGDPGMAKSQLLCFVERLAPRCTYTTGRGSSGVGLTAAIVKDTFTNEMSLEGGSLVMADGGICCIDEFDKMLETDRTAIHEVMEQQTVSIAKAGIMTSLNARVSVLAAANPAFSRYNPKRSLEENIQLPAALLSRFDIIWVMMDKCDRENDLKLAEHITTVHRTGLQPELPVSEAIKDVPGMIEHGYFTMEFLRRFIITAQNIQPSIPTDLTDRLVKAYIDMRRESRNNDELALFTSPRTLLALIRLSTAIARVRLDEVVNEQDVNEAINLMKLSKASLCTDPRKQNKRKRPLIDMIYGAIRELFQKEDAQEISTTNMYAELQAKGFTQDDVDATISSYADLGLWQVSEDQDRLIMGM